MTGTEGLSSRRTDDREWQVSRRNDVRARAAAPSHPRLNKRACPTKRDREQRRAFSSAAGRRLGPCVSGQPKEQWSTRIRAVQYAPVATIDNELVHSERQASEELLCRRQRSVVFGLPRRVFGLSLRRKALPCQWRSTSPLAGSRRAQSTLRTSFGWSPPVDRFGAQAVESAVSSTAPITAPVWPKTSAGGGRTV